MAPLAVSVWQFFATLECGSRGKTAAGEGTKWTGDLSNGGMVHFCNVFTGTKQCRLFRLHGFLSIISHYSPSWFSLYTWHLPHCRMAAMQVNRLDGGMVTIHCLSRNILVMDPSKYYVPSKTCMMIISTTPEVMQACRSTKKTQLDGVFNVDCLTRCWF